MCPLCCLAGAIAIPKHTHTIFCCNLKHAIAQKLRTKRRIHRQRSSRMMKMGRVAGTPAWPVSATEPSAQQARLVAYVYTNNDVGTAACVFTWGAKVTSWHSPSTWDRPGSCLWLRKTLGLRIPGSLQHLEQQQQQQQRRMNLDDVTWRLRFRQQLSCHATNHQHTHQLHAFMSTIQLSDSTIWLREIKNTLASSNHHFRQINNTSVSYRIVLHVNLSYTHTFTTLLANLHVFIYFTNNRPGLIHFTFIISISGMRWVGKNHWPQWVSRVMSLR